jgi:hypothetical protein
MNPQALMNPQVAARIRNANPEALARIQPLISPQPNLVTAVAHRK